MAVPCLALGALFWLGISGRFASEAPPVAPASAVPPAEIAARMLPDLEHLGISGNHDLEVTDAHIVHGAVTTIEGSIRNNTAHQIYAAEVVFDLTDSHGSQLGGVSARVDHLEPQARTPFKVEIPQLNASFALVRELHLL